jgi:hypothetical protein
MTTTATHPKASQDLLGAYTSLLPALTVPPKVTPPPLLADAVDDGFSIDITVDDDDLPLVDCDELEI